MVPDHRSGFPRLTSGENEGSSHNVPLAEGMLHCLDKNAAHFFACLDVAEVDNTGKRQRLALAEAGLFQTLPKTEMFTPHDTSFGMLPSKTNSMLKFFECLCPGAAD